MIFVKIHRSVRNVVAICDSELIGKRFEEGIREIEIKERFFRGKDLSKEEAILIIKQQKMEDATFNIVGKEAIEAAIEAELITKKHVGHIDKIPFALVLD